MNYRSILWLLLVSALSLPAQKREVFGAIGAAKAYDDEGGVGTGVPIAGGLGYRLSPKWGVLGEIHRMHHKREIGFDIPPFEGTGIFATANLLRYLSSGTVQPYVSFGGGLVHYDGRSGSDTGTALAFGGGVRGFIRPYLSVRPEVRVLCGFSGLSQGVEQPFYTIGFSAAIAYHW